MPNRRLVDPDFRWRGTDVSRLEGFSDAVFAIVLALLFLRAAPPESFTDLTAAMKALVPFALTFAIIAWVWVENWLFWRRYQPRDGWITFLNLVLLFLLLFYAYPLKFLFTLVFVSFAGPIGSLSHAKMLEGFGGATDATRLFTFYGVGYGSIFGTLGLMYWRALRLHADLGLNRVERFLTRWAIVSCALQTAIAGASIALSVAGIGLQSGLPGWVYGAIGPMMAVHGAVQGRRVHSLRGG